MSKRINIMLAYPYEERRILGEGRLDKWEKPYIVQPKLDGERCRAEIRNGFVTLASSTDEIIVSVPHIVYTLEELFKAFSIADIELDGELYIHGKSQEEIHGIISRKYQNTLHEDYASIEYHIFDIVNDKTQIERVLELEKLSELIKCSEVPFIKVVKSTLVNSIDEINSLFNTYIDLGYEGIILRNHPARYVRKRTTNMMKFKPKKFDYYQIVDFIEAETEDRVLKNMLGAIVCYDGITKFKVGAGTLTHDERINIWRDKDLYKNCFVKIGYQSLTSKNNVPKHGVCLEIVERNPEDE